MGTTGIDLAGHVQTRPDNDGHQAAGDLGDLLHVVHALLDHLLLLWLLTHPGPVHGAGGGGGAGHELCLQETGDCGIIIINLCWILENNKNLEIPGIPWSFCGEILNG